MLAKRVAVVLRPVVVATSWLEVMLRPTCDHCGAPKPKFSQVCDECWKDSPLNPINR